MAQKVLKEIQEMLKTDNSIYKKLVDDSAMGQCLCSKDGNVYYLNDTAINILNLKENKNFKENGFPSEPFNLIESFKEFDHIFKDCLENNKEFEKILEINIINSKKYLLNNPVIIKLKDIDCVLINIFDITEKKKLGKEIRKDDNSVSSIIGSLEDGYFEIDVNGNFKVLNKSFCEISGFDYSQLIDNKYTIIFDKKAGENIFKIFNEVYETEQTGKYTEWIAIKNQSKKKFIEGTVSLIMDSENSKVGFRGIIRDMTKRFDLEQELLRARKLEAIGILAGGIAHDYNNALTAILGNLSLAKIEVDPEEKNLLELLDDAESASLKIMDLTETLSSFGKTGKPAKKNVDSKKFIRDTIEEIFFEKKFKYKIIIEEDLKEVEIDQSQIKYVFKHIIENAIEAMPDGGVITIEANNLRVQKEESHHKITLQQGDYVMISFIDQGVGISNENLSKIFVPYFTTKSYITGMGLAISYAVIKRHSGYIDVKSEEGKGSTFSIYLPISPD